MSRGTFDFAQISRIEQGICSLGVSILDVKPECPRGNGDYLIYLLGPAQLNERRKRGE